MKKTSNSESIPLYNCERFFYPTNSRQFWIIITVRILYVLVFFAFIFFIPVIHAEETPPDSVVNPEYPLPLPEVTVFAEKISAEIGAFTRFDSNRISLSFQNSLSEIVDKASGAELVVNSRNEALVNIRGAIARDTRVFIEGRPLPSTWNGYVDLAGISTEDLSAVTIVEGPPPLKYGSNLGGAVILQTSPIPIQPKTAAELSYGSGEDYNLNLSQSAVAGIVRGKISLYLNGKSGFSLSDNASVSGIYDYGGLMLNSDRKTIGGNLKLAFPFGKGQSLFNLRYRSEERGIPPNTIASPRYWRFKNITGSSLDWQYLIKSKKYSVQSILYFDSYYNRLKRYSDSSCNEDDYIYDSIHNYRIYGWQTDYQRNLSARTSLNSGVKTHWDEISLREQTPASGGFSEPENYGLFYSELFSEGKYKFRSANELTLGSAILTRSGESVDDEIEITPRLGIAVYPFRKIQLSFNAARSVQFPTFQHLYDAESGNQDLKPETAWRLEAGGRYYFTNHLYAAAWKYHTFISDRIDRIGKTYPFRNLTDSELWGEELEIAYSAMNLDVNLSLSHLNVSLEQIPNTQFPLLGDNTPEWKATAFLLKKIAELIDFSFDVTYISEIEDYQGKKLPSYFLLGTVITLHLHKHIAGKFGIDNLLDEDYSSEYGFPQPGREFKIGILFSN